MKLNEARGMDPLEKLREQSVAAAEAYIGQIPLPVRGHLQRDLVKISTHLEAGELEEACLLAATLAAWETKHYESIRELRDLNAAVKAHCDSVSGTTS